MKGGFWLRPAKLAYTAATSLLLGLHVVFEFNDAAAVDLGRFLFRLFRTECLPFRAVADGPPVFGCFERVASFGNSAAGEVAGVWVEGVPRSASFVSSTEQSAFAEDCNAAFLGEGGEEREGCGIQRLSDWAVCTPAGSKAGSGSERRLSVKCGEVFRCAKPER